MFPLGVDSDKKDHAPLPDAKTPSAKRHTQLEVLSTNTRQSTQVSSNGDVDIHVSTGVISVRRCLADYSVYKEWEGNVLI